MLWDRHFAVGVSSFFFLAVAYRGDFVLTQLIQGLKGNETWQNKEFQDRCRLLYGFVPTVKILFQHPVITQIFRPFGVLVADALPEFVTADAISYGGAVIIFFAIPFLKSSSMKMRWIGIVIFMLRELMDSVDGEVARLASERKLRDGVGSGGGDAEAAAKAKKDWAYFLDGYADSVTGFVICFICLLKSRGTGSSRCDARETKPNRSFDPEKQMENHVSPKEAESDSSNRGSAASALFISAAFVADAAGWLLRRPWLFAAEFGLVFILQSTVYHHVVNPYWVAIGEATTTTTTMTTATTMDATTIVKSFGFTLVYHVWCNIDPCFIFLCAAAALCLDKEFQFCRFVSRRTFPLSCCLYFLTLAHIKWVEKKIFAAREN